MDWTDRLLSPTPARLLRLLRRDALSAGGLAEALDISGTAVRGHLGRLEERGLVTPVGSRPGTRRPETLYGLTPQAEQLFPKAYAAAFSALLALLREYEDPAEVEALLRETGRRLAAELPPAPTDDLPARLTHALDVIEALGGLAEVQTVEGQPVIRGASCPLGAVVAEHPQACALAVTLLEEVLGVPVREVCEREPAPRCAFAIGA